MSVENMININAGIEGDTLHISINLECPYVKIPLWPFIRMRKFLFPLAFLMGSGSPFSPPNLFGGKKMGTISPHLCLRAGPLR